MTPPDGPLLVVVGPPGAGKTTVGSRLANRWRVEFRDTDRDVEAATGKEIGEIFVDDGEAVFRGLEAAAVREALQSHVGVLALGGGAVQDPSVQEALAGHRVLFLDVGLADAAARVGLGTTRPLLLGNVRSQLKALLDARRPLYRAVATTTILTDGRSIDEVVDAADQALAQEDARD